MAERTDANWGQLDVLVRQRSSEEWEDNWKQYYKPFKVGQRLVVCPSWEKYQPAADELLLMIEPGGSFGTGQHQTTRLCLELLEQYLTEYQQQHGCLPEKLLDLGCGTGILSIGGLLLGVNSAAAVDIEEHSAHAAAENAALNDIAPERYQTFWGNILDNRDILIRLKACADHGGYDIIVVNIVADVIIAMSSLFAGLLAEQGRVFCSGFSVPVLLIIAGRKFWPPCGSRALSCKWSGRTAAGGLCCFSWTEIILARRGEAEK